MDTRSGLQVIGLEAMKRRLERVDRALSHKEQAYKKAVIYVDGWVQQNFRTEGGQVGGWVPLKASTIARRRKGKGSGSAKILQDKGWLRSKWKHHCSDSNGSLVSGVEYGVYHDSDKPRKKLPQRRILPRHAEVWPKIKQIMEEHIARSFHD